MEQLYKISPLALALDKAGQYGREVGAESALGFNVAVGSMHQKVYSLF
jgi:hypothetical protein